NRPQLSQRGTEMSAGLSSPIILPLSQPLQKASGKLPCVSYTKRSGPILHSTPFDETGQVLGLNLAAGCAHQCIFCAARAYANYPGDGMVQLYAETARQLADQLKERGKRPRAVLVSPSTDPFPPLAEVQAEARRVISVLARRGVEAWLMTRGYI